MAAGRDRGKAWFFRYACEMCYAFGRFEGAAMKYLHFAFGIVAYVAFFAVFLYLIGFVGDLYVPLSVDRGPAAGAGVAVVFDLLAVAVFGMQHSVMARAGFKTALARTVPPVLERSLYVLMSSVALVVMFVLWRPIGAVLWDVQAGWARAVLWGLFLLGWGIVFVSTWLLNHFELFGLAQHWRNVRGLEAPSPVLREPLFYKWVRHPLYSGFLLSFWATPTMTVGHALLAGGITLYVLIAIGYEERDLLRSFGPAYVDYRRRVGSLIPGLGKAKA
jgi:protein-S-isoprenylcysteine O-methyltransferase Ste14